MTAKDRQEDLFAYARRTDPWTSHEAAASMVEAKTNRYEGIVLACLQRHGGCTIAEAVALTGEPYETLSPRFKPLVKKKKIHDSGIKRRNTSGRQAIVWVLGPVGGDVTSDQA